MVRLCVFILVGCVVCAGLIPIEFGSITTQLPSPEPRLPATGIEPAAPESQKLPDPLSSPDTAPSGNRVLGLWC